MLGLMSASVDKRDTRIETAKMHERLGEPGLPIDSRNYQKLFWEIVAAASVYPVCVPLFGFRGEVACAGAYVTEVCALWQGKGEGRRGGGVLLSRDEWPRPLPVAGLPSGRL
jgi:hypothetical protein